MIGALGGCQDSSCTRDRHPEEVTLAASAGEQRIMGREEVSGEQLGAASALAAVFPFDVTRIWGAEQVKHLGCDPKCPANP